MIIDNEEIKCECGCSHAGHMGSVGTLKNNTTDTVTYKSVEDFKSKVQWSNTFELIDTNSIIFNLGSSTEEVGRLFKKDGLLCFDGDLDSSAIVLFEYVCKMFNKD